MDVLIVVPRYSERWGEFYQFPLGLGYIASALRNAGHTVSGLNLNHSKGKIGDLVSEKVRELNPDMCASGGLSPFLPVVQEIFSAARKAKPSILNLGGGGMVAGEPGVILDVMDIDYGVVGEGEETVVELVEFVEKGRDLELVKGIVYRDEEGLARETAARPQMRDLGSVVAWPDYELLSYGANIENQRPMDSYFFHTAPDSAPRALDMITSRSCPFKCTFCFHPTGKTYRERPLDDFFDELDMLIANYDINMVALVDELFSLKKRRLLEFCERIEPYKLRWMVQLHVNSCSEETIAAMKRAGCTYISYGIESMSQPILVSMEKKSKVERINSALELTYKNRIGIQGNLLFGDSAETLDTANESMHWWSKHRHYQINLTPLMVFPGSPDYLSALEDGMIEDRVSFVKELPEDFNISSMNNDNMAMVRFMVWVFAYSLLNIAPSKIFRPSEVQAKDRDPAYDIIWDCPRCGHENEYIGVVLPEHQTHSIRLSCRECVSRWDLRNQAFIPEANALNELECVDVINRAKSLLASQDYGECHDLLNELMRKAPSFVPARTLMGSFYREVGPEIHMVKSYGAALGLDPFDADLHCDFADALVDIGALGAARLHYSQAALLDNKSRRALDGVVMVDGAAISEGERSVYFISWSDNAPPVRQTKGLVGARPKENVVPA